VGRRFGAWAWVQTRRRQHWQSKMAETEMCTRLGLYKTPRDGVERQYCSFFGFPPSSTCKPDSGNISLSCHTICNQMMEMERSQPPQPHLSPPSMTLNLVGDPPVTVVATHSGGVVVLIDDSSILSPDCSEDRVSSTCAILVMLAPSCPGPWISLLSRGRPAVACDAHPLFGPLVPLTPLPGRWSDPSSRQRRGLQICPGDCFISH
jgi:hypothetical protein